jgi:hypothetical protein
MTSARTLEALAVHRLHSAAQVGLPAVQAARRADQVAQVAQQAKASILAL